MPHSQPTLHPLTGRPEFCCVIPGFLSREACQRLIAHSEARGFTSAASDYPPSYRNNDRQVMDDAALATEMLGRVRAHLPATLPGAGALHTINERFRLCRYQAGQQFNIHQDGVHHRDEHTESRLTFLVYLSDGDEFEGGDTLFYAHGPGASEPHPIARVRPRAGSLIVFDHSLWHAGECVRAGVKHILRSDVLYRREPTASTEASGPFTPGHRGYVWALAALSPHTLASGGRDAAIRLWSPQGQPQGQLLGHTQSVLGLAALPGERLASVSRDRSLRLWHWQIGVCERVLSNAHEAALLCVAALPTGLATGGADGLIKLWSHDATPIATLHGHTGWVWSIAALPSEGFASASEDGSVKIWQGSTCTHTLPGTVALRSLAVSPDGECIVTGNIRGEITVWALHADGWVLTHTVPAHTAAIRRVRWLGEHRLASAGEDNQLRLWSLPDFTLQHTAQHDNFATDVLALGATLFSCAYDGHIHTMQDLPQHWAQTWESLGLPAPADLLSEVCQRYSEPHRKYHTLQHLRECLALCERDQALAERPAEVAMALWFHDAIYERGRADNEAASAAWASSALLSAGATPATAERVHALIMATRHSELPELPHTPDAQLLVDIDLSILGAAPERFAEYEQQIREEYQHVPGLIFRMKRRAVLQSFLDREQLYNTPAYRERYEAVARTNLRLALT